jgi:hypothetical protein
MSSSKNIDLSRDFAAGVYVSTGQRPIHPPPFTHCKCVYSILIHTRKGEGGEVNQREGYRGATVHKAGSKIPT